MWRFAAGVMSALLLVGAGFLWMSPGGAPAPAQVPLPKPQVRGGPEPLLPEGVPSASPRTREQKRFDRYDKDRNSAITRDEYLATRRKAFARLDKDGDGRLSFEEWAAKTIEKFAGADKDRSGTLNPAEFATTKVERKPATRRPCVPPKMDEGDE
jgi:hypothetical protein